MPTKRSKTFARSSFNQHTGQFDRRLVLLVGILLVFGLLMVYSASVYFASQSLKLADGTIVNGDPFSYIKKQVVWVVLGMVLAVIMYRIPLRWIARTSVMGIIISIVLLVVVLLFGTERNGATRWIDLGSFDLQPSEIAKLGFIVYLSAWLSRTRPVFKNVREIIKQHLYYDLIPFMLLMGVICALIVLQPDLDTAAIIAITALTLYFVSGKDAMHTVGSMFIVITTLLVGVFAAVIERYRLERIKTYIDFWLTGQVQDNLGTGFQVWNSLIAIGTGGVFGLGYGQSIQKLSYLANEAAFTDSIFAVIAEEFGLLGSVGLITAFLYFTYLGIDIAKRAPDKFSALLAIGITTWISLQAFLNIGANLALIPFGGIPLPFISYGGSSTLLVLMGVGLLLNVSKHSASR